MPYDLSKETCQPCLRSIEPQRQVMPTHALSFATRLAHQLRARATTHLHPTHSDGPRRYSSCATGQSCRNRLRSAATSLAGSSATLCDEPCPVRSIPSDMPQPAGSRLCDGPDHRLTALLLATILAPSNRRDGLNQASPARLTGQARSAHTCATCQAESSPTRSGTTCRAQTSHCDKPRLNPPSLRDWSPRLRPSQCDMPADATINTHHSDEPFPIQLEPGLARSDESILD